MVVEEKVLIAGADGETTTASDGGGRNVVCLRTNHHPSGRLRLLLLQVLVDLWQMIGGSGS